MLIGNRQMQRKPSMPRITIEVDDNHTAGQDSDVSMAVVDGGDNYDQRFLAMLSPRNHTRTERKESKDCGKSTLPSSSFLGSCGFCKRRLAPGRDIYMYKGDAAFCSMECREQQIEQDRQNSKQSVRVVLSPSN